MKKIIAAVVILALVLLYVFFRPSPAALTSVPETSSVPKETTNLEAVLPKAGYKDGSYTGNLADAIFGPMQVQAIIKNGHLVDVAFLKYPNDEGYTKELNAKTMPVLTQEAIKIQSSDVDAITGATQTVDGFKETLKNALAQAKA